MPFKVLKQLYPAPSGSDPSWAQRKVWVEKLTPDDTIYEYSTENQAMIKRDELSAADSTGRLFKVTES